MYRVLRQLLLSAAILSWPAVSTLAVEPITVADASLSAAFYSDSSCLLTIDSNAQAGKTVIDANVDGEASRMLIHCDTVDGRRLTLLARGDALNVAQRAPLLSREEIEEGELGMIAWLTRSGVHYADDSAPRRYVIAGSVMLRKSPPVQVAGSALHSQRHAFGRVVGILEPLLKSKSSGISATLPLTGSQEESEPVADESSADTATEEATESESTAEPSEDDPPETDTDETSAPEPARDG
ncbi:hypothetical protein ACUNV4_15615 [Granulosicoccus sp. 3-233]|uniref:hypothetical protein n=1 Tax=Granulosicoccus sp. 3-233 TaxID=3417969 RepID=UPI003D3563AA